MIVDRRTVIHELALEGDEQLEAADHVALVDDGVSIVAVSTDIDDAGSHGSAQPTTCRTKETDS